MNKIDEPCCENKELINHNGTWIVCKGCGQVERYNYAFEYVNFHENKYKIRRKSVYHRKYHVQNMIRDIA